MPKRRINADKELERMLKQIILLVISRLISLGWPGIIGIILGLAFCVIFCFFLGTSNSDSASTTPSKSTSSSVATATNSPPITAQTNSSSDTKNNQNEFSGVATIVDGDTLKIDKNRFRLYGIDAPESKQQCLTALNEEYACGELSHQALVEKVNGQPIQCVKKNNDRYGRIVAVCYLNGEDLNAWMVKNGYAVAYPQYGKVYVPLEKEAKKNKAGIWAGSFEIPSQWRKEKKGKKEILTLKNKEPLKK